MGRTPKNIVEPCCYHITHRCQERRFLFKFKQDRDNYLYRLRESSLRFGIAVLNYIVTSNHVHILIFAPNAASVSRAMHFLQGASSSDYNRRKKREGSFWRGRYKATMIQTGPHLSRCIFYIDMNMVRAGVCAHPSGWDSSGYHELSGARKRYRIIDIDILLKCLGHAGDKAGFADWYGKTLADYVKSHYHARESFWSESFAIGSEKWLAGMARGVYGARLKPIETIEAASGMMIKEDTALYGIYGGKRAREAFWNIQQNSRK